VKTVVCHDLHFPFHSRSGIRKLLDTIRRIKPDHVVLNGDILDLHALTTHRKDSRWEDQLGKELDSGYEFLCDLRKAAKTAEITYIRGNHESRYENYIQGRAPALRLIGLTLPSYLELGSLGIRWVQDAGRTKVLVPCGQGQKVRMLHGDEFNGSSKFPAAQALKVAHEMGCNIHQGHTHRLGVMSMPIAGRLRFAVEGGYLANPRSPAMKYAGPAPKWTQAFSIYDSEKQDNPYPQFVLC